MTPLNLYLFKILFKPSVFLAADLAADGSDGSIASKGGQSPLISFKFHSFSYLSLKSYISLNFFFVSTWTRGNGIFPKKALKASHTITFESFPRDHSIAIFLIERKACLNMKILSFSNFLR